MNEIKNFNKTIQNVILVTRLSSFSENVQLSKDVNELMFLEIKKKKTL